MSGFQGINQFGSLTVNGQKLTFEDFDKDKDGKVNQEEYDALLKEVELDSVELSSIDKDGDKTLSEEEFEIYEQKLLMQDAVNEMKSTISTDFSGSKSQYLPEVTEYLKDYINGYALTYVGEVSSMAEDFKTSLPAKYEEIKQEVLKNDTSSIKSQVLDDIINEIAAERIVQEDGTELPSYKNSEIQTLGKRLEAAADVYMQNYTGANLQTDLTRYLQDYMNKSDSERLADSVSGYREVADSLGIYIDSDELVTLKEAAKEFLTSALENGMYITLGDTTITSEGAITTALANFTDAQELNAAMETVFNSLSTEALKTAVKNMPAAEAAPGLESVASAAPETTNSTGITGADYKIDLDSINCDYIRGYRNNGQISARSYSWYGGVEKAQNEVYNKATKLLQADNIKNQVLTAFNSMVTEKGIGFDGLETIFENVYNQSISDTLNSGIITTTGDNWWWHNVQSNVDIKSMVDTFLVVFNENIAKAVDDMNSSNKDMDLQDIDYEVMASDRQSSKFVESMKNNSEYSVSNYGPRVQNQISNMLERLRSQLLSKSYAMCSANGIDFDMNTFSTTFENAKNLAINTGITPGRYFYQVTVNPQEIVSAFTENFSTNYTAWVNGETNSAKETTTKEQEELIA